MTEFSFHKQERLCCKHDVKAVFKHGYKYECNGASLFVLPSNLSYNRFLCTFKRGYGSAVMRNRARRVSKEVYRLIKSQIQTSYDFILIVFSPNNKFYIRKKQIESLFKKADILKPDIK